MGYFAAFAETGVPAAAELALWKPLGEKQTQFLRFGDESPSMTDIPQARLIATQALNKPFPKR